MKDKTPPAVDPYFAGCRSRGVLDHVADRWTILLVGAMSSGEPVRFSDLLHTVQGISTRMLTKVLRSLIRDGLVVRTVHDSHPVQIDYRLTELGSTLLEPLAGLRRWAVTNVAQVSAAQQRHDLAARSRDEEDVD